MHYYERNVVRNQAGPTLWYMEISTTLSMPCNSPSSVIYYFSLERKWTGVHVIDLSEWIGVDGTSLFLLIRGKDLISSPIGLDR